ncbi:MAG: PfkB family carbohydrate kinase, partial [Clostridia bacterium]
MRIGVNGLTGLSAFFTAHALPRPAETIRCTALHFEAGGKGHNQAVACARLGATCVFVGAVGRYAQAEQCRTVMNKEGVQPLLVDKEEPSAFAAITTAADGENIVQV